MRLITELNEDVHYITEEVNGKKKCFIEGIFLQSGIANKNKRIYPEQVMSNEVNRYIKESVNKNKAWGELGHPAGPTINLDKASHLIKSLVREGKNYIGKAEILETTNGNIVKALLEAGGNLGVSSRGLGSLRPIANGLNEVMDDFKLSTAADIVADPSAPDAFVNGILENQEYYFNGNEILAVNSNKIQKQLKSMNLRQIQEQKLNMFRIFMDGLVNGKY